MAEAAEQYHAGFLDGDGCVLMKKPSTKQPHPIPLVTVDQAHNSGAAPEVEHLQRLYGGRVYKRKLRKNTRRTMWQLQISALASVPKVLGVYSKARHCKGKPGSVRPRVPRRGSKRSDSRARVPVESKEVLRRRRHRFEQNHRALHYRLVCRRWQPRNSAQGQRVCGVREHRAEELSAIRKRLGFGSAGSGQLHLRGGQAQARRAHPLPHGRLAEGSPDGLVGQVRPRVHVARRWAQGQERGTV